MSDKLPAILERFGGVVGLDAEEAKAVLFETVLPKSSRAEAIAFLAVCSQYGLNPLLSECHAFVSGGRVRPLVGIDGWIKIAVSRPEHESIEHEEVFDAEGRHIATTARVWKRGSERPTTATEYLSECQRNTPPWKQSPKRMLRHRAVIQAIRLAYGVGGLLDPEDADRLRETEKREAKVEGQRLTILDRAKRAAGVEPEPPTIDVEATEPPVDPEDMAGWLEPVAGDPEAAQ